MPKRKSKEPLKLIVNEIDGRILYDNFQLNKILLLKTYYFQKKHITDFSNILIM